MTNVETASPEKLLDDLLEEFYRAVAGARALVQIKAEIFRRMEEFGPISAKDRQMYDDLVAKAEQMYDADPDLPEQSRTLKTLSAQYAEIKRRLLERISKKKA